MKSTRLHRAASALRPYLVIAIAGSVLSSPLVIYGLPLLSDDGIYHAIYYENFSAQLWAGNLYPRWLAGMYGGLGAPTFFYYPPLVYYFTNLFELLPISTLHKLGAAAGLALVLSGITAFVWLKEVGEQRSALFAACLYMLLPYHINFDLFVRGAVAEAFAFVWMPLILFYVLRIARGGRYAVIGLAVCFAMLAMSHLLTTAVFAVVPIAYCLATARRNDCLRALLKTLSGMALGAGMACVYLLPALTYQEFVYFREMKEGTFGFERGLFSTSTVIYGSRRHFWILLQVTVIVVASYFASRRSLDLGARRQRQFWTMVFAGCLAMMHYISYPVWSLLTPLQMLQFPFRFNTVASVAVLPLVMFGVSAIRRPVSRPAIFMAVILTFFCLLWVQDIGRATWISFFRPQPNSESSAAKRKHYELYMDAHGMWPRAAPRDESTMIQALAQMPRTDGRPARAFLASGSGQLTIERWEPRVIDLQTNTDAGSVVNIAQLHYPGWRARIADSQEEILLSPTAELGILSAAAPPGLQRIEIRLEKLAIESAGEWISIASWLTAFLAMLGLILIRRRADIEPGGMSDQAVADLRA